MSSICITTVTLAGVRASSAARASSAPRGATRVVTPGAASAASAKPAVAFSTSRRSSRSLSIVRRAGEGETESAATPTPMPVKPVKPVKSDPFGFGSSNGEPQEEVKMIPGFDTAEGGKVGPVGTFFISVLLIVLFGGSIFFTSVPRGAIQGLVDLSDDPNAPTNVFK
eukprot:CAMPEP_0197588642 /NCGR_PEP_ID=MMETSP1326-20131121/9849_1 /TAXON_ID=1155430 /ORGANISM="Genus nov. species nov., Strain RCC2288" /LENGTH=167 /DNA_ID=CAMNT_0043153489 /DNA_START=204 /DNA_END=707 /DNA_ORIENTATION=+